MKNTNIVEASFDTTPTEVRRADADTGSSMPDPVHELFAATLRLPLDTVHDGTSPENTPRWDSLQAINLVLALEEEFGITLGTRDIAEMKTVGLVKKVLHRKGVTGV